MSTSSLVYSNDGLNISHKIGYASMGNGVMVPSMKSLMMRKKRARWGNQILDFYLDDESDVP